MQTIGRIRGEGGGLSMMLCGHLDTFPPPAEMANPYRMAVRDNRIYGAGVADMKAGTAAAMMAADAVLKSGVKLRGDVVLALVMEEQIGGVGITHLLGSGVGADMGIVPESTNLEINTTGAGIAQFTVSTFGKSTHIGNKEDGVDAVAKMAKVIDSLSGMEFTHTPDPRVPKLPRYVASTIIGGRGTGYDLRGAQNLSDFCTLLVDVRFWKSMSEESIETDLRKTLDDMASDDPEFKYQLSGVPSPFGNRTVNRNPKDVPLDSPIVRIVQDNHRYVTGERATFKSTLDTARNDDSVHMVEAGIPTVTYGPGPGSRDVELYNKSPLVARWIDTDTCHACGKVMALSSLDVCTV
jgi:acetylornithine deacetylase